MNENQFSSLLTLIVPPVIQKITQNSNISEEKAITAFYCSKLYHELSVEDSKLWHYGPAMLYSMYQDELITGSYDYPEEA
ncbi:MAG: hypothetical protein IJ192_15250 [Clostridia bacterium]|nr:hypothetical protein [Clostridia bacterium]